MPNQSLRINGWEKFQYYKHRRPPWIRLYVDIIDEFDRTGTRKKFYALPDDAKLTFMVLLCLASHYDGVIPDGDVKWIQNKTGITKANIKPLIDAGYISACNMHAECMQGVNLTPPQSSEFRVQSSETDKEIDAPSGATPPEKQKFEKPDLEQVKRYGLEIQMLTTDAEAFFDHFETTGWRLSAGRGGMMKDWHAALRRWKRNQRNFAPATAAAKIPVLGPLQNLSQGRKP
jgi:hypothetical protein